MNLTILISLFIYVAVPVGTWFAFRAQVKRRFAAAEANGAICGTCGYSLRGVGSFECPECGGDLREVGMVPPKAQVQPDRVHKRFALLMLLWTILVLIALNLTY